MSYRGVMDPVDRKSSILAVAAEMFATCGYSGTGVDEIGQAIGISGPALYRHFSNKQAILDEIIMSALTTLLEQATAIVAEKRPPMEILESLVELRIEYAYGPHRYAFEISHARDTEVSNRVARKWATMNDLYKAEWVRVISLTRPSASTAELQVAWLAAHHLIGFTAASVYAHDEEEHKRHLKKMAMAVLLA